MQIMLKSWKIPNTQIVLTCSLGGSGHPEIPSLAVRGFFPPVAFSLMSAVFYSLIEGQQIVKELFSTLPSSNVNDYYISYIDCYLLFSEVCVAQVQRLLEPELPRGKV